MTVSAPTVLVIDDAPEDRVAFRRYLTLGLARPYRVLEAQLGSEGLQLWREQRPDCVLLDYQLPDCDGLAVLTAMSSHEQSMALPVVMLTLRNDPGLALRAISVGAQDYLTKDGLSADDLRRAVANTLERMRLHAERKRVDDERRELLAREQMARLAAEEALRSREAFLAVASHELKTPLTTMLGNLYLLQRRLARSPGLAEQDAQALRAVEIQGHRLKRMVNTMLDVSDLQMGGLELERAPLNLSTLMTQVVDEERRHVRIHTLRLHHPEAPVLIQGDGERLAAVFHALVGNALKYSPEGGLVEITITTFARDAVVTVTDEGIGVAPDLLPLLLQPFARAGLDYRHYSGMGVGLYVSNAIVTLHGGTLSMASESGVGSVVTVVLPLVEAS